MFLEIIWANQLNQQYLTYIIFLKPLKNFKFMLIFILQVKINRILVKFESIQAQPKMDLTLNYSLGNLELKSNLPSRLDDLLDAVSISRQRLQDPPYE